MGQVQYFCIEEWGFANEFKHSSGIVEIFVDPAGTRLVFLDVKSKGFVYNAVSFRSPLYSKSLLLLAFGPG